MQQTVPLHFPGHAAGVEPPAAKAAQGQMREGKRQQRRAGRQEDQLCLRQRRGAGAVSHGPGGECLQQLAVLLGHILIELSMIRMRQCHGCVIMCLHPAGGLGSEAAMWQAGASQGDVSYMFIVRGRGHIHDHKERCMSQEGTGVSVLSLQGLVEFL